jgi:hypothetical protein
MRGRMVFRRLAAALVPRVGPRYSGYKSGQRAKARALRPVYHPVELSATIPGRVGRYENVR